MPGGRLIHRRRRKSAQPEPDDHADTEASTGAGTGDGGARKPGETGTGATGTGATEAGAAGAGATTSGGARVGRGPFDAADAPDDGRARADFGALVVPRVNGTRIRVSASGPMPTLAAMDGTSVLELSVLAAPRSGGLWASIREDLVLSAPEDTEWNDEDGPYGPELRMPLDTAVGRLPARIFGIEGPRWILCAVITGAAAVDVTAAPLLEEVLDGLVVVRGDAAMPVREPIPFERPDRFEGPGRTTDTAAAIPEQPPERRIMTLALRGANREAPPPAAS